MNLHNLFEDDSRTPNPNYAEELAYQIFKAAPDLDTTGAADEVLDYAYDLVVNDFGKTKANALFAYDEDFDGDLVNAYLDLQMNQQAVDKKQVNEVDPRNFDSDEDYYAARNAPAKRRSAPSDYPYSPEEDDAYFREIFRKKREAAKKAAQDKGSLSEFAEKPENGPGSDEYEDLLFHLAWEMWSEAGDSAQAERKLSLLGWKPEFGDDYTAMVLYKIGNDDDHRQYTIDEFEEYGGSGDEDLDESRMSELDAEYEDYKKLSPREFFNMYRITKQAWLAKYKSMLPMAEADAQVNGQEVDASVVVGKLYDIIDHAEDSIKNADFDRQVQYATTVRDRAIKALNMIKTNTSAANSAWKYFQNGEQGVAEGSRTPQDWEVKSAVWRNNKQGKLAPHDVKSHNVRADRSSRAEKKASKDYEPGRGTWEIHPRGNKGVAEADKKKEDELEPQVKDVALQRAISRAKADFPTAGTGIEALAKDFMRSQDQDSKSFDQLRQAERKQDQMLGQIAKIDQEQEQEIKGLENQNSTLSSRLQQLQNVNGELEKKLAAMSGRKAEKKSKTDTATAPAVAPTASEPELIKPATKKASNPTAKAQPATSKAIGQIAKTLAPPAPSAAIDQMAQQLKPRQKELDFDNNPVTLKPKKFDTSRATDVAARDPREIAKDVKQNIQQYGSDLAGSRSDALRNLVGQEELPMENNDKEAKYSNKYQDMVARVGQKAREQEKSKPVDIKDLARRLAAIEASRKD